MISEIVDTKYPGGRPIKFSKRDVLKSIRFTKAEYTMIEKKAAASGVSVTIYIRQICLHGKVIQKMDEEEKVFVRQLIGMADNLNQRTKKVHQEGLISAMFLFEKEKNMIDNFLEKMERK